MKKLLPIVVGFAMLLVACNMNEITPTDPHEAMEKELREQYDRMAGDMALALNMAIRNSSDFRELIKNEVMIQFDGDYDLLLSTAITRSVNSCDGVATRTSDGSVSVRDMLDMFYPESELKTRAGGSVTEAIVSMYPALMISVPIHAEKWDPETYIPSIAIVTSDYVDTETEWVPGIDPDGNPIMVDAINEPDVPFIVVSLSERYGGEELDNPEDDPEDTDDPDVEDVDYIDDAHESRGEMYPYVGIPTLSGNFQNGAIRIRWSIGISYLATPNGFDIYRAGPNNSYNFTKIGSMPSNARTYDDWGVTTGQEYVYYIMAKGTVNSTGVELTSKSREVYIVAGANKPMAVTNFSVNPISNNRNELKWTNPAGERFDTRVYVRKSGGENYMLLATLDPNQDHYIHGPSAPGQKWTYKVHKVDYQDRESDRVEGYVYNPYRNPEGISIVNLKRIAVDNVSDVEGWIAGKPEFYIKVYGLAADKTLVQLGATMDVKFKKRGNVSQDLNHPMHSWSYFDHITYYPAINFHMIEYDRPSASWSVTVDAKAGYKHEEYVDLSVAGQLKLSYEHRDKDCGYGSLLYFENPNQVVRLQNYGARLQIGD